MILKCTYVCYYTSKQKYYITVPENLGQYVVLKSHPVTKLNLYRGFISKKYWKTSGNHKTVVKENFIIVN